jgi:alkanesulfonate monooxygenase SsuD/methylene tetrahydromethanopterin reductase-like flavin-dependent oxidoreductase (luciferase family)
MFEAYTAMAAVATATERASVGLLVGANTFRNPALVAKMITTLDHISGGRMVLGIGGAWFETEHKAMGMEFGGSPGERLRWLGEALPIMRDMLHGKQASASGPHYAATDVLNLPPPVQERLPILIGGSGPKVTTRLVAEYADMNDFTGLAEDLPAKEANLLRHCERVGRDERTIERTFSLGTIFIRDSREEALAVMSDVFARNGGAKPWPNMPAGTVDDVVAYCEPHLKAGYHHLIFDSPAPYDEESLERLATEVRPRLEALVSGS